MLEGICRSNSTMPKKRTPTPATLIPLPEQAALLLLFLVVMLVINAILLVKFVEASHEPSSHALVKLFEWAPFNLLSSVIYTVLGVKGARNATRQGQPSKADLILPIGILAIVANWLTMALN